MGDYDPYDDMDLTNEEMIQMAMGASVNGLELRSNEIEFNKIQAGIVVEALREYRGETKVEQETARRLQTLLREKFDIE